MALGRNCYWLQCFSAHGVGVGLACFGPICFEMGLAIGDDDPAIITMYGVENTSYILTTFYTAVFA